MKIHAILPLCIVVLFALGCVSGMKINYLSNGILKLAAPVGNMGPFLLIQDFPL